MGTKKKRQGSSSSSGEQKKSAAEDNNNDVKQRRPIIEKIMDADKSASNDVKEKEPISRRRSNQLSAEAAPPSTSRRRTLTVLVLVLMLDLLAFTCILPLFPALMHYYAAHAQPTSIYAQLNNQLLSFRRWIGAPESDRMNGVFFAGFLGSVFSFLQFVASPVVGSLSDVLGRRPTLIVVTCGSLLANCVWLFAYDFPLFVLFRVVAGLCKSSVSIATAVIADVFAVHERGRGMALIGLCFSFGFLFGPLIGAVFARSVRLAGDDTDYPFAAPACFAVALSAVELTMVVLLLPETLAVEKRKSTLREISSQIADYVNPRALFAYRAAGRHMQPKDSSAIRRYGYVYFMFLFLYSGLEFTLSFFTHDRFGYESIHQGRMYFFAGLVMVFVQGAFVRRVNVDSLGACAQCGLAAIVPAYITIAFARTQTLFFIGLALYAFASTSVVPCPTVLSSASVVPCLTTLVANRCADGEKGAVLGVLRSQGSLARALGPFAAACFYWYFGATICYGVGGCLLLIPFVMLRKLARDLNSKSSGTKCEKGA